jgi:hypothetical protein
LAPDASVQLSATAERLGSSNAIVLNHMIMAQIGHRIIPPKSSGEFEFLLSRAGTVNLAGLAAVAPTDRDG